MSGGRHASIVCLLTSLCSFAGVRRLQISSLRLPSADKRLRHWIANLLCASFSSTQKRFVSRFSESRRKSRNDRWSSRTGTSGLEGILKTEWSRSILQSTAPLEISNSRAREAVERGLARITIEPTTSRNSLTRWCLSEAVSPTSSWFRTGRYVASSLDSWLLV